MNAFSGCPSAFLSFVENFSIICIISSKWFRVRGTGGQLEPAMLSGAVKMCVGLWCDEAGGWRHLAFLVTLLISQMGVPIHIPYKVPRGSVWPEPTQPLYIANMLGWREWLTCPVSIKGPSWLLTRAYLRMREEPQSSPRVPHTPSQHLAMSLSSSYNSENKFYLAIYPSRFHSRTTHRKHLLEPPI